MIGSRIRSPLRWLWTVLGSLSVIAAASLTGQVWLLFGMPIVWIVFLTLPPIMVFRHDETPVGQATLRLQAMPAGLADGFSRYNLLVSNASATAADGFRIRLVLPRDLSPPGHIVPPLGQIATGRLGEHWFTETIDRQVVLTFRASGLAQQRIIIDPEQACELCELNFATGRVRSAPRFDFQISGGNVRTVLGTVALAVFDEENEA